MIPENAKSSIQNLMRHPDGAVTYEIDGVLHTVPEDDPVVAELISVTGIALRLRGEAEIAEQQRVREESEAEAARLEAEARPSWWRRILAAFGFKKFAGPKNARPAASAPVSSPKPDPIAVIKQSPGTEGSARPDVRPQASRVAAQTNTQARSPDRSGPDVAQQKPQRPSATQPVESAPPPAPAIVAASVLGVSSTIEGPASAPVLAKAPKPPAVNGLLFREIVRDEVGINIIFADGYKLTVRPTSPDFKSFNDALTRVDAVTERFDQAKGRALQDSERVAADIAAKSDALAPPVEGQLVRLKDAPGTGLARFAVETETEARHVLNLPADQLGFLAAQKTLGRASIRLSGYTPPVLIQVEGPERGKMVAIESLLTSPPVAQSVEPNAQKIERIAAPYPEPFDPAEGLAPAPVSDIRLVETSELVATSAPPEIVDIDPETGSPIFSDPTGESFDPSIGLPLAETAPPISEQSSRLDQTPAMSESPREPSFVDGDLIIRSDGDRPGIYVQTSLELYQLQLSPAQALALADMNEEEGLLAARLAIDAAGNASMTHVLTRTGEIQARESGVAPIGYSTGDAKLGVFAAKETTPLPVNSPSAEAPSKEPVNDPVLRGGY